MTDDGSGPPGDASGDRDGRAPGTGGAGAGPADADATPAGAGETPTEATPAAGDADRRTGGDEDGRDAGVDWRGWLLVAVVVACFVVVPWTIVALPSGQGASAFGLPWRDTFLALPMIPAVVLGIVAVWTALRARDGPPRREE